MADLSVLTVLVATNGGSWLRPVIQGVRSQTFGTGADGGTLDVIAVDNASTDRSRGVLERAFGKENVVRLDRRAGYARAIAAGLKAAGDRAAHADAFLFLHDDCAMEPEVVASLVDALGYEDVGVAGPKLADWDNPEILQEAGLSIDRYARVFDPLERGELDQGQYDKVREVMWVSSACMLVTRACMERAGFFDHRFVMFREDMDFCWRARLSGFKVAFTGASKARHVAAAARDARAGWSKGRTRYFTERNLLASLIKNYSRGRLALILPMALLYSIGNSVLYAFTGRRREAGQIAEAVRWNVTHFLSTIRSRAKAQRGRTIPDAEVMKLATKGAHRVRALVERGSERIFGSPAEGVGEAEGLATPGQRVRKTLRERIKAHPTGSAFIAIGLLYLVGSRALFSQGGLAGTDMPAFPDSPGDLFGSFLSGWRLAETGGAGAAPPASFLSGLLSVLTLGSPWLAQRILIFGLPLLAALTASRLAAHLGCGKAARRAGAFVYAMSPLALWALGEGRLSDMVLLAAAPGLCIPIARAAGLAPWNGWRDLIVPGIGCAVAVAFSPWTLVFIVVAAAAFAAGAAVAGRGDHSARALVSGLVMAAGTMLVLFPWSLELFREGTALGIGGTTPRAEVEDLLRLSPGGLHAVPLLIASLFPVAAAAGFALAPGERSIATRALAVAGAAGLIVAVAVERGVPFIAPRSSLPLALTAVSMAMLIGFGVEGVRGTLRGRQFGLSQIGLAAAAIGLVVVVGSGALWFVKGTRPGLGRAGEIAPTFLAADRDAFGDFRVLWLDGTTERVRVALTAATGDDFRTYGERRAGPGHRALDDIVAAVAANKLDAAGRQLAPFGVRYVFVREGASRGLIDAFARQSDLRFMQRFEGSSAVFANDATLPVGADVTAQGWALASTVPAPRTTAAIAGAEADPKAGVGFERVAPDLFTGSVTAGSKRVVLGTTYDSRWRLVLPDQSRSADAERSFGWATGFRAAAAGRAAMLWGGQSRYRLLMLAQLLILVALGALWSRQVAKERGER